MDWKLMSFNKCNDLYLALILPKHLTTVLNYCAVKFKIMKSLHALKKQIYNTFITSSYFGKNILISKVVYIF